MSPRDDTMKANRRQGTRPSVLGHGDLATSLILMFPLFLAYEVGGLLVNSWNGVDFITRHIMAAVHGNRQHYLLVQAALAVLFLAFVLYMRHRRPIRREMVIAMILESCVYALTLGTFILFVMDQVLGLATGETMNHGSAGLDHANAIINAIGPHLTRAGEILVVSLGAGVHEELVFRLGLMAGGSAVLKWCGMGHSAAVIVALILSSVAFSLAHHVGPYGEVFSLDAFVYRALAGGIFGLIFYYRSLAHAVYSHVLYDVYVLTLQPPL